MKNILCFGSYAKIVKKHINPPQTQGRVTELLLNLVLDNETILTKINTPYVITPKITSELFNHKENVQTDIRRAATTPKIIDLSEDYFEDVFWPEITPTVQKVIIGDIVNLIKNDNSIIGSKKGEFFNTLNNSSTYKFLADTFLYALQVDNRNNSNKEVETDIQNLDTEIINSIEELEVLLERIGNSFVHFITPPKQLDKGELTYTNKLFEAYASAENRKMLSKSEIETIPKYKKDFNRRREDYYAAESVRRGARDAFSNISPDPFEVLKEETYNGIVDIYEDDHLHGLARLRKVMSHVTTINIDACIFSKIPNVIGQKEKKGVCHLLINDGVLKGWVNIDE